ncbi:MAG: 2Fe-2S iron-sulfur cluster-binding protein [Myxococcota bacterium]|nr:2Fe-2S iron-sulfur cluster-binding protein [Myxococcota bacterium]
MPSIFNKLKQKIKHLLPSNTPVSVQFNDQPPITIMNGLTLLQIAKSNGFDISHYCGGVCSCGTCRIHIEQGGASLSAMSARESLVLGHSLSQQSYRLACQAKAIGPETIKVNIPSAF